MPEKPAALWMSPPDGRFIENAAKRSCRRPEEVVSQLPVHSHRLAVRKAHGLWLRQQRQARGWSVVLMRRKLREAAKAAGDTLPDNDCLTVMIHRWENGRSGISERYRMHYCRAFQIPVGSFGDPAAGHPSGSALLAEVPATAAPASGDEECLTVPGQPEITAAEQLGAAMIRVFCEYLAGVPVLPLRPAREQWHSACAAAGEDNAAS